MHETSSSANELQKELDYYKKKLDELSGESIRHDYVLSSLRNEVKQRKDALGILTSLQKEFSVVTPLPEIFAKTVKAINTYLGMDRSVILNSESANNTFQPCNWYGFPDEHILVLEKQDLELPSHFLKEGSYLLLNKATPPDETGITIQKLLLINYFIGVPVFHDAKPIAFLIAGRLFERVPFSQPLNKGDADTLMAIASLITTVFQNKKIVELRAEMKKQKEENTVITKMLAELKATQSQLIQKEKMASLGELTAGIAHEIQNPLNFVNNFSDVNNELLEELKEQLATGNGQEAMMIAEDVKKNEIKINYHGRRADAIVKGMLQHSRANSGKKESTDINALADEYLRLSYHGLRAKDKSFNATFKTDFDETVGKIEVVPQDIGRVLLNLYNNAFYAASLPSKARPDEPVGRGGFKEPLHKHEPTVWVTTKKEDNNLVIRVRDNGIGIPQKIVDKIFQPFFTTKPTGEGTGLGLSLSYDIIKAHGGEMKVETKEEDGAEFIIKLPV